MAIFPDTERSLLDALRSDDTAQRQRAMDLAARVYRGPIVAVAAVRWQLQPADAEDLAHDFLLAAFEKRWFERFDPARGRFRTFVRSLFIAFAGTQFEAANRLKRGGAAVHVDVDALPMPSDESELDALFDREWARSVLTSALEALREECMLANRASTFAVFVAHTVDGADADRLPTYAELAVRFDLPITQVTNFLNWSRRRLRAHVLATLRGLTVNDDEYRAEARTLLGVDVTRPLRQ